MNAQQMTQDQLLEFLQDLLDQPDLEVNDDLFGLGLTSLQLMVVQERILKECGVCIELQDMFTNHTVGKLAALIEQTSPSVEAGASAPMRVSAGTYPASPAQTRMYVMAAMDPGTVGFNMPEATRIVGPTSLDDLEAAVWTLHRRHESLHTRFAMKDELFQIIDPSLTPMIVKRTGKAAEFSMMAREFIAPFDLLTGPLYRVLLFEVSDDDHYGFLDIHLIIADGWSLARYFTELLALIEGNPLSPLPYQYKDYVMRRRKQMAPADLTARYEETTRVQELGPIPGLELPTDWARPPIRSCNGARVARHVSIDLLDQLARFGSARDMTTHMVLMAAFSAVLQRWSGQRDFAIGCPNAGRDTRDFEQVVGMFVNMTVNRIAIAENATFEDLLRGVRTACLASLKNSDIEFNDLVDWLHVQRNPARNPVFDYVFAYQNVDIPSMTLANHSLRIYEFDYRISRFDMFLSFMRIENDLRVLLEYSTDLFLPATAEDFVDDVLEAAKMMCNSPTAFIADLPVRRTRKTVATAPVIPTFSF